MNFEPKRVGDASDVKFQQMFESLPVHRILKLSEEKLKELMDLAECLKNDIKTRKISYFNDNHSIYDFFFSALRLFNSIFPGNILRYDHFIYQFEYKDEIGLFIMFFCDKDLHYLNEYKKAIEIYKTGDLVKQRMIDVFGFYSQKLCLIETHYTLLLKKLNLELEERHTKSH